MNQKILAFGQIIILAAALNQHAFATSMQLSVAGHHSQCIENTYAFTLKATCTIQGAKKHHKIRFHVLQKEGTINGKHLRQGQSTSISVNNQETISVDAEPSTKVSISNLDDSTVQANCSV